VPSTVGLALLRVPIVSLIFQHGQFKADDTLKVAFALLFYTITLWAVAGARIMTQSFFAMKNSRTPAIAALVSMIANVIGCAYLTRFQSLGFAGVVLSTSIAGMLNFLYLFVVFQTKCVSVDLSDIFRTILRCTLASVPMAIISIYVSSLDFWLSSGHIIAKILWLSGAIGVSMATYFGIAYAQKMPELEPLMAMFKRRIR
jgi:putative peptidoglycan lipid II flippase